MVPEALDDNGKFILKTEPDQIVYADSLEKVEELASLLINAFMATGQEFGIAGIDFEGDMDTLQVFARWNGKVHAYVFQLSLTTPNNRLPPKLFEFFNLKNLIFASKIVEKELLAFLTRYGFSSDRLSRSRH